MIFMSDKSTDITKALATPEPKSVTTNTSVAYEGQQINLSNECIRVNKVYDWLVLATDQVQEIPIPGDSLTIIENALAADQQLLVTATINLPEDIISNIVSIVRKIVIIDDQPVEVGCAQILKTVTLDISVFNITTGASDPITTFTSTFQILERAGLCFPDSFTTDNIALNITSATATSLSNVPVNGNFIFEIGICQDLQVETEVNLKVPAEFCEPRENTIDCGSNALPCPPSTFPEQCPNIFPGN